MIIQLLNILKSNHFVEVTISLHVIQHLWIVLAFIIGVLWSGMLTFKDFTIISLYLDSISGGLFVIK